MTKTLVQRLAGFLNLGRLPAEIRTRLESEGGITYLAEGVAQTAMLTDFRAPGIRCAYRRISAVGCLAMSPRSLVLRGQAYHQVNVDLSFEDPGLSRMHFALKVRHLAVRFDAQGLIPEASGGVELRLGLPDAPEAARLLRQAGVEVRTEGA